MIVAVTLNPCIDRTIFVDGLDMGGHNVATHVQSTLSGKGINVNVVLHNLGIETKAVGFEFTDSGTPVSNFLHSNDIPFDSLAVNGALRINYKIFDSNRSVMTEINCLGPTICEADYEQLINKLEAALDNCQILVLDGSAPPGVPRDCYRQMTFLAHSRGIPVILDATDDLLENALPAKPDFIKPNISELEKLLGRKVHSRQEALTACHTLIDNGVGTICLSLGKDGAMLVNASGAWYSKGVDIQVKGFQGAGDSMVAGICLGLLSNLDGAELLRFGVAAAHGSLIREGTLLCLRSDFDRFLQAIKIESL